MFAAYKSDSSGIQGSIVAVLYMHEKQVLLSGSNWFDQFCLVFCWAEEWAIEIEQLASSKAEDKLNFLLWLQYKDTDVKTTLC